MMRTQRFADHVASWAQEHGVWKVRVMPMVPRATAQREGSSVRYSQA